MAIHCAICQWLAQIFEYSNVFMKCSLNIIFICICVLSLIQVYLDICLVNSWASKYIWIFIRSIHGHSNIFWYLCRPISCTILPYADHSWPIWINWDQCWYILTCFSKDTHILMIFFLIKWPAYMICIHIHGFSSIRIDSDIGSVNSWASEYI